MNFSFQNGAIWCRWKWQRLAVFRSSTEGKNKTLAKYWGSSTQDDPCRSNIGGLRPLRCWRLWISTSSTLPLLHLISRSVWLEVWRQAVHTVWCLVYVVSGLVFCSSHTHTQTDGHVWNIHSATSGRWCGAAAVSARGWSAHHRESLSDVYVSLGRRLSTARLAPSTRLPSASLQRHTYTDGHVWHMHSARQCAWFSHELIHYYHTTHTHTHRERRTCLIHTLSTSVGRISQRRRLQSNQKFAQKQTKPTWCITYKM